MEGYVRTYYWSFNIRLSKLLSHFLPIPPFIEGISFGILMEWNGICIPSGL